MNGKPALRVESVMSKGLHSVDRFAPVSKAIALMRRHGVRSLLVPRHDDDDEPGLVTISDVAHKVISENHAPERVNVYEIMSKPVLTVPAEMQARYAVRLLVRFGVSRALVVGHDREPLGIATLRDLVLAHVED